MAQIKDSQLLELQTWVKSYPFKAPADKKLRKVDGDAVKDFIISHKWWNIEIGNVMTHVRYFRLFPDDTLDEHRQHVLQGKGNAPVRATRKRLHPKVPTVKSATEYKVTARYHEIEIEIVLPSVEDLAIILKSFHV